MKYKGLFIGLTTVDIQYFVEDFPGPDKKVKTDQPEIYVGGPASNAAVAFSVLNKGAFLASAVGKNSFQNYIHNDFEKHHIKLFDLQKNQMFSPVLASVVTSGNGDRNIFTHNPKDVASTVSANELMKAVKPDVLLIDGFYPGFAIRCAKFAQQHNIPVIADCGSWKPQYHELLDYVNVAICSEDFIPPGARNITQVFEFMATKKDIHFSAVSRGEKSILYKNGKSGIKSCNIPKVDVADTLGAGDFLHGAFCFYLAETGNYIQSLEKASEMASFTCLFKGTRNWIKYFK